MYLSECCGASFLEPGYPDTDLCGQCHEHTGAYDDEIGTNEDELNISELIEELHPQPIEEKEIIEHQ